MLSETSPHGQLAESRDSLISICSLALARDGVDKMPGRQPRTGQLLVDLF